MSTVLYDGKGKTFPNHSDAKEEQAGPSRAFPAGLRRRGRREKWNPAQKKEISSMRKKCAVYQGAGKKFLIQEYEVEPPAPETAGLELVSSGICGTDVHIHQGRLGMPDMSLILGHEFIGRIHALGSGNAADAAGNPLAVGDCAIACVAIPCGKCLNCLAGETASCLAFGVTYEKDVAEKPHFHGGFSEYLYSPFRNLMKIPASVDPFAAAAFPCGGPTVIRSCAYGGGLKKGEIVVIQGNGSLGLFAVAYAKAHGCCVIVVGSEANEKRRDFAMRLGADEFYNFRTVSTADLVRAVADKAKAMGRGDGADVVIETSGAADAFPTGLSLMRTRGRYFVPGQYSDRGLVSIPPHLITFRALQIFGSGQYTMDDLASYVKFLEDHAELQKIFREMVTPFPVADADAAIEAAGSGSAIKAVFVAG